MKKYLLIFLLAILMFSFSSCSKPDESEITPQNEALTTVDTWTQGEFSGIPPISASIRSESELEALYKALRYDSDDELREYLYGLGYGSRLTAVISCDSLSDFWERALSLPLPDLSQVPNLTESGLEYYPQNQSFILWYVAGGRQYRFTYVPGPLKTTEAVLHPVATGELHGAEIALGELAENSPFEYEANFYLKGYNVKLRIRNDRGVTNPKEIFLDYSDDPWVTFDKADVPEFHMEAE